MSFNYLIKHKRKLKFDQIKEKYPLNQFKSRDSKRKINLCLNDYNNN